MSVKDQVVNEFERRVFEEFYSRIFKCLTLIEDKDLWKSPQGNIPPIGCLVLHLAGNARQWILSALGDKPDNRNREDEFMHHSNIRKTDLVFLLQNLKVQLKECLYDLDEASMTKKYQIQGFDETGFSAIIHVIEHFSYHTGQITTLAKMISNKETGYYADFNLNQLNNLN
jgi:uncharacterized damage-inducible protein DinB